MHFMASNSFKLCLFIDSNILSNKVNASQPENLYKLVNRLSLYPYILTIFFVFMSYSN